MEPGACDGTRVLLVQGARYQLGAAEPEARSLKGRSDVVGFRSPGQEKTRVPVSLGLWDLGLERVMDSRMVMDSWMVCSVSMVISAGVRSTRWGSAGYWMRYSRMPVMRRHPTARSTRYSFDLVVQQIAESGRQSPDFVIAVKREGTTINLHRKSLPSSLMVLNSVGRTLPTLECLSLQYHVCMSGPLGRRPTHGIGAG